MFRRIAALWAVSCCLPAQIVLPDGKGREVLDNSCQECHGLEPVIRQSLPAAKWRKTILKMTRKGATLTPEDVETLVDYLTTYFGPETPDPKVNINKADAGELRKALGIGASEARSILRLREAGGPLKNWNDLVKLDAEVAKKLEAKRDSISFR